MPKLTIELIRENPWNVINYYVEDRPDELLDQLAALAVYYCVASEEAIVRAFQSGSYTPPVQLVSGDEEDRFHDLFEPLRRARLARLSLFEARNPTQETF